MHFLMTLFVISLYTFHHAQASYAPGELFEIQMPNVIIEEFVYEPLPEGYRYGYKLPDGSSRQEVGILLNGATSQQDLVAAGDYARNNRPSHRPGVKNRKLSPKALQSAAG